MLALATGETGGTIPGRKRGIFAGYNPRGDWLIHGINKYRGILQE